MTQFLNIAWIIVGVLKFGGLAVLVAGFAVFGAFFVRGNARAARNETDEIPVSSWRGAGPILGAKIFGAGIAMQILCAVLAAILPARL